MESAEAQLREIQLALKYCDLDYREILEDYREHLKVLEQKAAEKTVNKPLPKQINKRSA
jgi:uncharacterized protein YaaW (UPF0174 family)